MLANEEFKVTFTNGYNCKSFDNLYENYDFDENNLFSKSFNFENGDVSNYLLENLFKIPTICACYEKKSFNEIGEFDENMYAEDPDMFLRLSKKYKFGFVNEILLIHRIHDSNPGKNSLILRKLIYQLINKYKNVDFYNKKEKEILINYFYKEGKIIPDHLINYSKDKKIIIWGTGSYVISFLEFNKLNIEFFLDSNSKKEDTYFKDKLIKNPKYLLTLNKESYFIYVASTFYKEIYAWLNNNNFIYLKNYF